MAKDINDLLAHLGINPNATLEELSHSDELFHYGVPGMRWGKRKGGSGSSKASSPKVTVKALSDEQLKAAINRMKLENEFIKLATPPPSPGKKAVQSMVAKVAQEAAEAYLKKGMAEGGDLVKTALQNRR